MSPSFSPLGSRGVSSQRMPGGVPRIRALSWPDAFAALGWFHGTDRGGQIAVLRLLGQGRLCETLRDDEELLGLDLYFRRLGLARDAAAHAVELPSPYCAYLEAYCRGVTLAWNAHRPWPLRLARYRPEPMLPSDILLILKLTSYVGLVETQRTGELFAIEAIRRGTDPEKLAALLPALGHLEPDLVRNLREVPALFPDMGTAASAGSNAWAVNGALSSSGKPLLCCDPHLEVSWLPPLGYEAEIAVEGERVKGFTLPGLPGFLVGRTGSLAWGVTYACADTSDFFVERCRGGQFLRNGRWCDFVERREVVGRKRHPAVETICYESDHGILEGRATTDGDHLSWNWTGLGSAGLGALQGFSDLLRCRSVIEAQAAVRKVDIPPLHFVFADQEGNIGYQFTGALPERPEGWNGLAPAAGWTEGAGWAGRLEPARHFPSELNPDSCRITSANEARRSEGGPSLTTLPMAGYRRARIRELLGSGSGFGVPEMQRFQYDVVSTEARKLLPVYLPLVPAGRHRELLGTWDHRYDGESLAACLFENIHRAVTKEVLGSVLGREWVEALFRETNLYLLLADRVGAILVQEDSPWMSDEERKEALRRGVAAGLAQPVEPWGRRQALALGNVFLGAKLGRLPGLRRGPHPLPGSHATVRAGVVVRARGRRVTVAPAYHFIADLASEAAWTNLPGGPTESPLSLWYAVDLRSWLRGSYKRL